MVAESKSDAPELSLDAQTQHSFAKWFNALPQDPHIIRFFDRKGVHTAHGEAALMIARQFYRTTAVVKYWGGGGGSGSTTPGGAPSGLASVTLNRSLFESVLRELLLEGGQYSVELYSGYGANWTLERSASPGRLAAFEEELFRAGEPGEAPPVAAVSLGQLEGQLLVGAAFLDTSTRQLGVCEFHDDQQLGGLEALLLQLGAREVVVAADDAAPARPGGGGGGTTQRVGTAAAAADARRLRDVLDRVAALGSARPRSSFSTKHLEQDLGKVVRSGSVEQHRDVLERPQGCAALSALISFAELLNDPAGSNKYSLALYDPGRYMRLDAAAQRALNVLPQRGDASSSFSLYGLLNRARTAMGKRRLKVWLKQPLVDVAEINTRLDVVEALVSDTQLRDSVRDALRGLPDVERLTRRLEAQRISLAELCQLYRASSVLPRLEEAMRAHEGAAAQLLVERYAEPLALAHNEEHLTKFEMLLEAAIDLDRVPEEYVISAQYDPKLQSLREGKDAVEGLILELANTAARDLGLVLDKTIKLEWHKVSNCRTRCLRITQKEEKAVRSKLTARYLLLETRKDGTKFTNRPLKDAAERLNAASGKYEELQRDLVAQVVAVAHTFVEVWERVGRLLAEVDVLAGFAELACSDPARPYTRPEMLEPDGGELVLRGCRHPCVEAQEGVCFVANDCVMRRGESWFNIITGPNMGGKSTFIRQVGVVVLMAQVGCFVPADAARIAPRDAIFARVGAGDCQLRGVSTFMAEMLETSAILAAATPRSLIIIDELGRGTSTYDGFGLAWAIGEYICHSIRAPCLFATHFHELTELDCPGGVANLHVDTAIDAATGKLTMLYRIKGGACDQSFGIHVAESANFPADVVEAAKQKLAELEGAAAAAITNHGGCGGRAAKRARIVDGGWCADGESQERARRFLADFAALPLGAGNAAPGAEEAGAMRKLLQQLEEDPLLKAAVEAGGTLGA